MAYSADETFFRVIWQAGVALGNGKAICIVLKYHFHLFRFEALRVYVGIGGCLLDLLPIHNRKVARPPSPRVLYIANNMPEDIFFPN